MKQATLLLLALVPIASPTVSAQQGRFDAEKTRTVLTELIEKEMNNRGIPSISIALVRGDSIVWTAAFGYANVRTRTPATPETIYSTGSTFKSATAVGLMQLVEQGKLNLDRPVNQYLGDIQIRDRIQSEKPVTSRHMLTHRSGLVPGAVTKPIWGRQLPKTLEEMVSTLYSIRAPEEKYEYNNFAYGMAGLILEKLSGQDYETYMLEHVLRPLGITTAHPVYPSPEMVELMALPYSAGGADGKPTPVAQVHFDVYPAGDIYLTAEDMARFLGMLLNDGTFRGKQVISAASAKAMRDPPYGGTYGFGLGVRKDARGHTIIAHSGGIPGQSSYMIGDVDAQVGAYYMSNSGAPPSIGEAAILLLQGEEYVPPPERKPITVDAKVLERYVGVYEASAGFTLPVTRDAQGLLIRLPGSSSPTRLFAETPTRFFVRNERFSVVFVPGPSGVAEKLLIEAGETIEAKRKDGASP